MEQLAFAAIAVVVLATVLALTLALDRKRKAAINDVAGAVLSS